MPSKASYFAPPVNSPSSRWGSSTSNYLQQYAFPNSSSSSSSPLLVTEVAPVLQAASNPLNAILLQTAGVEVSFGNNSYSTRMVLDSGAVMSLVTSRLVNTIRAKRLHTDMAILSLGGTTAAHNNVELLLTSIMCPDSPPLRVDAYVVDKLCDHRK